MPIVTGTKCPFCGEDVNVGSKHDIYQIIVVKCSNCRLEGKIGDTNEEAIELWVRSIENWKKTGKWNRLGK